MTSPFFKRYCELKFGYYATFVVDMNGLAILNLIRFDDIKVIIGTLYDRLPSQHQRLGNVRNELTSV